MSEIVSEKNCTLLFLRREDEILLAMKKRGFGAGRYNGVGGKIELGETIEQALLRETREEIGVVPMHYWPVAEHTFNKSLGSDPFRMRVHVYFCDEWQGDPTETEEMTPQWFEAIDIPYDQMWSDDELWLPQVLSGNKVVGEFTFNADDSVLAHKVEIVEILPSEQTE